jgi:hypothetical protein
MAKVRKKAHHKLRFVNIVPIGCGGKTHWIRAGCGTARDILGDVF